jgi:hypothetical protein
VAKKRRITTGQARMLAIVMIRDMSENIWVGIKSDDQVAIHDKAIAVFEGYLPEKWFDGQTSDQSWDHVWDEARIQYGNIMDCLVEEAKRLTKENPGFKI